MVSGRRETKGHRGPMRRVFLVAAVLISGFPIGAHGQPAPSTNYTSIEVEPGKPTQVGYYAQAHNDCSPSKLPIVRVVEVPTQGVLTVRPGELKTDKVATCPNLKLPAQVVTYRPKDKAAGSDHVMYSVTYPDGEIALYDVTIRLKEPPAKENKL